MLQSRQKKIPFYDHEKTAFFAKIGAKNTGIGVLGVWLFQHKAHSSNLKQVTFVLYTFFGLWWQIFMRIFLLHYLRLLFKFEHTFVSRKWKGATHRILYFCILPPFVQLSIFISLVDTCVLVQWWDALWCCCWWWCWGLCRTWCRASSAPPVLTAPRSMHHTAASGAGASGQTGKG